MTGWQVNFEDEAGNPVVVTGKTGVKKTLNDGSLEELQNIVHFTSSTGSMNFTMGQTNYCMEASAPSGFMFDSGSGWGLCVKPTGNILQTVTLISNLASPICEPQSNMHIVDCNDPKAIFQDTCGDCWANNEEPSFIPIVEPVVDSEINFTPADPESILEPIAEEEEVIDPVVELGPPIAPQGDALLVDCSDSEANFQDISNYYYCHYTYDFRQGI